MTPSKVARVGRRYPDREPLRGALDQPAPQEPFCYHDGRNIVCKEFADDSDVFPLYTWPQPEQDPLTDEQIEELYFDGFSISKLKEFARAIEAAHGIGEKK